MALEDPALPPTRAAEEENDPAACHIASFATPTPMLEQTLQSSGLSAIIQTLLLDLREDTSPVGRKVAVTAQDETATFTFA